MNTLIDKLQSTSADVTDLMTSENNTAANWWGNFDLQNNKCKQWQIGPLKLIVRHLQNEWQIAYDRSEEFDESWEITDCQQLPDSLKDNSRYIFNDTSGILTLRPLLADRSIITRPIVPFNLTAGEQVTLYVSSILCVQLSVGASAEKVLKEILLQRPSDTWFGPSTLEGELCYASNTHCRLSLDELPHRPHRAITPVEIFNQTDTTLLVERLNLPAPLLHLYASETGQLWTPKVTLIREKAGEMAKLKIENTPPEEALQAIQLSEPRIRTSNGTLFRAFNAVFR